MIKLIVAFLGYWSGLDALFYWLNRKAKRVLTFHNVLPDAIASEVPSFGYADKLSEFASIIEEIGRRFVFDVDVDKEGTCTITFDDGYLNEYEVAGKWLMERNIPAILFVAGNIIGAKADDCLSVDKRHLKELGIDFSSLSPEWKRLRFSGVTKEQLDDLRAHGWLVGWHSKSHEAISQMTLDRQREELAAPSEYRNVPMSYPFGMSSAVSMDTIRLAKEAGFPCAFSNDPWESPMRGNFYRMRYPVSTNKYEMHFLLSGLKYFIQHRKLLPRR